MRITSEWLTAAGVSVEESREILNALKGKAPVAWNEISRRRLSPQHPFIIHETLFHECYASWDVKKDGPPPAWTPTPEERERTNLYRWIHEKGWGEDYRRFHQWTITERAAFWREAIQRLGIRFSKAPQQILDESGGTGRARWLTDAALNIADACFSAAPEAPAIVYESGVGQGIKKISYRELDRWSNRVANGLRRAGFKAKDRIAIDMTMTAESVAIYLGIIKAGCAVVSIADSFSSDEISTRLKLSEAKGIFTQDHIWRGGKKLPLYEKVIAATQIPAIVLPGHQKLDVQLRPQDHEWQKFLPVEETFASVAAGSYDIINVLFSSGTTGEPKAIPWFQITPIKCALDGYAHQDIQPGDVVAWPTNLGWMMGPWLIFATLINRGTIALYYESPLEPGFAKFIERAEVKVLGLVPSLVKAWRNTGATDGADWRKLKAFSSTGECSNASDYLYLMSRAGYRPVIEYCGGTEIGGGFMTGTLLQPASPATFSTTSLGLDVEILDDNGEVSEVGELFLVPPSVGLSSDLLGRDHYKVYYDGVPPRKKDGAVLRRHGDQFERLPHGYFRALGRADDTMNLGGIKVSSAEIERTLNLVPSVSETAAIAVNPPGGGPSLLVIFAVLKPGTAETPEALKTNFQRAIKEKLNPLFKIHDIVTVSSLPRTASNKIMRRVLRADYERSHG